MARDAEAIREGRRLAAARAATGMRIAAAAAALEYTRQQYSAFENGRARVPHYRRAAVAKALGVTEAQIWGDGAAPPLTVAAVTPDAVGGYVAAQLRALAALLDAADARARLDAAATATAMRSAETQEIVARAQAALATAAPPAAPRLARHGTSHRRGS